MLVVGGFTFENHSNSITLLDVTNPLAPRVLSSLDLGAGAAFGVQPQSQSHQSVVYGIASLDACNTADENFLITTPGKVLQCVMYQLADQTALSDAACSRTAAHQHIAYCMLV